MSHLFDAPKENRPYMYLRKYLHTSALAHWAFVLLNRQIFVCQMEAQSVPDKHIDLTCCWFIAVSLSATLAQHYNNNVLTFHV